MELTSISSFLSVVAVVTVIAVIAAYLMVQFRKATVQILQENNSALSEQVDILKKDLDESKVEIGKLRDAINHLSSEYGGLRQVIDDALDRYFTQNPDMVRKFTKS